MGLADFALHANSVCGYYIVGSKILVVVADLGFTTLLPSQVISVAFYSERGKSDKFCSEALISS